MDAQEVLPLGESHTVLLHQVVVVPRQLVEAHLASVAGVVAAEEFVEDEVLGRPPAVLERLNQISALPKRIPPIEPWNSIHVATEVPTLPGVEKELDPVVELVRVDERVRGHVVPRGDEYLVRRTVCL